MKSLLIGIALVVGAATPALAAPQDVANDIADEVMSPFCEGVTLHDCPSQAAADLRTQIEEWARQGLTKAEIMEELEDRYGAGIHATPQDSEGLGAWVLPAIALLAGLAGVFFLALRWTRRSTEAVPPVADADHARVERELAALREETS